MDLTRINCIKDNIPKKISKLWWQKNNTNSFYEDVTIYRSEIIYYECSFCHTKYNNAIAYIYDPLFFNLFKNKIYRCLNCLKSRTNWTVENAAIYDFEILHIISIINEKFSKKTFILSHTNVDFYCSSCKKKKEGYQFKYHDEDKFLCFMCYCNYKNNTGAMSMSRKPTSNRKRVNKKSKSTRKRSNKKYSEK